MNAVRDAGVFVKQPGRVRWLVAGLLAAVLCGLGASAAVAGNYTVRQCGAASHLGFAGDYFGISTLDRVHVVNGCRNGEQPKLGIYQDRSGRSVPRFGGGQFIWSPDPSVRITGTTINARLRDSGGMRAQIFGARSDGGLTVLDEGHPHDGQLRTMRWRGEESQPAAVIARLWCLRSDGCENNADTPKAYFEVYDLEIESRDSLSPEIELSGEIQELSKTGKWHRGEVGYRLESTDRGSGVARTTLEVNGVSVNLPAVACEGDRGSFATSLRPCPREISRNTVIDTTAAYFRDGLNSYRFCVSDYAIPREAGNRTCTGQGTLNVDNTPPLPPVGLEVAEGGTWQAENGFKLSWRTPPGQASDIASADYRIISPGSGIPVASGSESGDDLQSIASLEAPHPGAFRVEVRLTDEAGNLGEPASTLIRFDNSPPGDVRPLLPSGWISEDELPLEVPIERAVSGGPSGIGGYAIAINPGGPIPPCSPDLCAASELVLVDDPEVPVATISGLAEGSHWITAVAASGAGVASRQPGSRLFRVDRTDPESVLSGQPAGWSNRPVTLTVTATDDLSGMTARPATDNGEPMVAIAPAGQHPYESPGNAASFTVATEGITTVRYWARDLAGNTNDGQLSPSGKRHRQPESTSVRIDLTPPSVRFFSQTDPRSPEVFTAEASDGLSGIQSGVIQIRSLSGREGSASAGFAPLPTEIEGGRLQARIPSDDFPAGMYELRALATDRAGNTASSSERADGSAMVLTFPLKREVNVSLRHLAKPRASGQLTFRHGSSPRLSGQITDHEGEGMPGARLTVEERFESGSRPGLRTREIAADEAGRFEFGLSPGPGRSIRVLFEGTDLDQRVASRSLKLAFRDQTTLAVTPEVLRNGSRTTMTGVVTGSGARQPAAGKLVAIEFFDPDRRLWRPIEVLRADRQGRFRFAYRFRTITVAQRIIFRAVSLAEAGWPYRPSTSPPRTVTVYPSQQ